MTIITKQSENEILLLTFNLMSKIIEVEFSRPIILVSQTSAAAVAVREVAIAFDLVIFSSNTGDVATS